MWKNMVEPGRPKMAIKYGGARQATDGNKIWWSQAGHKWQ